MTEPAPTILLLTADPGRHTRAALEALVRALLVHVDPACRPHAVRFEPASDEARAVVHLHDFADRPNVERARLHRAILEALMSDAGFVVVHVDAQRPWRARTADPSENLEKLQRHVVPHVRAGLEAVHRRRHPGLSDGELRRLVDARMTRFFRLVPYWSLESWLYQNSERARALCLANPACRGGHVDRLAAWAADRAALDETADPSAQLCFGKPQLRALVDGFPTAAALAPGKSLAAFVDALRGCEPLLAALRRTHALPADEEHDVAL